MTDVALQSKLQFNTCLTKSLQSAGLCEQAAWHREGNAAPLVTLFCCLRFRLLTSDRVDNF